MTGCPHSKLGGPCSQCAGVVPTVVTRVGTEMRIGGEVVRASQPPPGGRYRQSQLRGARHSAHARIAKAKAGG